MSNWTFSRSPVLDYATSNPIPVYVAPIPPVDLGEILDTEAGFDITSEDGSNIGIDMVI